ncbi:MAG: hypothetical protein ACRCTP_07320 [Aeromonas popoffii]|uniref:hypothetical protein n=1 Tax=Aeromonas popoffii TaxID=70856 RepID=UPI003F301A86
MTDKTPQNKAETPVNTPATLARTTDTARRALPQADALKSRFKAGSIPLQTDFADLIDLANIGRQAVGGAEGQTGPANGFTLSSEGLLELKPNAAKGISVDQDGVAIKVGSGLQIDSEKGVSLIPEQTFQKGMVMMFSGTGIPSGWALCDGNNGTPNLVDRFIIGGKGNDVGKTGGQSLTESGGNKTYTVNTNAVPAGRIDVSISGTALAARHIPPHTHNVKYTWNTGSGAGGYTVTSVANAQSQNIERRVLVDAYGNSAEAHTHSGTASQGTHGHTINSLPAYYILAFIMKL